jgi:hypothetical protein
MNLNRMHACKQDENQRDTREALLCVELIQHCISDVYRNEQSSFDVKIKRFIIVATSRNQQLGFFCSKVAPYKSTQ